MVKRSLLAAAMALVLSILVHGLGLGWMTRQGTAPPPPAPTTDVTDVGGEFEDFVEDVAEPPAPEVTPPEPVVDVTPTSDAQVASDNPQNVTAPDAGAAEVVQPDGAEPLQNDTPVAEQDEIAGGPDDTNADIVEADAPDAADTAPPTEGNPDAAEPDTAEAVTPETVTPDANAAEAVTETTETTAPDIIAALPDAPQILTPEATDNATTSAVTRSLRPPKERPTAEALGVPEPTQQRTTQRSAGIPRYESPLTAFKRSGVDLLARGGSGRSGSTGFSGSGGSGNAASTNYAGRVLVQLNRTPRVFASESGTARVQFQINADGSLAWVRIVTSTGSANIDRAARAQVQRAAPFPRPPTGTSQRLMFVYRNQ